ncbi:MAG: ABC transporter permease [Acidobacteria bacterium]|nr:ABC transporter permease [Acidobacteriota bacterium]
MNNLVVSNLTHHPGRTAASVIGVAVGVILVVLTVGLVRGMLRDRGERDANIGAELMMGEQGQSGISPTSQSATLPISLVDEIRKVEGVAAATGITQNLELKGEAGLGIRQVDGIDFASYVNVGKIHIVKGEALPPTGDFAIVDEVEGAKKNRKIGDYIESMDRKFKIVGVYSPEAGARIKIPLATMQEGLNAQGKCSMILVKCNNTDEQEAVARRIDAQFPDKFRILFTRDLPELFANGFSGFNIFLNLVAGLSAFISILVILLTMYTSVTERTRQIGIMKALGASKSAIAWVFEKEALFISGLGVVVGLSVSFLARWLLTSKGLKIEMEPKYIAAAVLAGLLSGLIGALYPALRAARQDPIDALSYE